ncbi:MAG: hypothetical protein ACKPKO_63925, partial [Candidatus Fonsibacter sp.]
YLRVLANAQGYDILTFNTHPHPQKRRMPRMTKQRQHPPKRRQRSSLGRAVSQTQKTSPRRSTARSHTARR